jgi:alpha-glucosidase
LFGDALLVVPVTSKENIKKTWLPAGEWYDLFTDELIAGDKEWLQEIPVYQIPVYVKASSILPLQSLVQSTKDIPSDTLNVHIFNGNIENSWLYYEDAGDGFDYQKGNFCKRNIEFNPATNQIIFGKQEGDFSSKFKKLKVILHGFNEEFHDVLNNQAELRLEDCSIRILDGLENLADYYDKNYYKSLKEAEPVLRQKMFIINNSSNEIKIQLK